MKGEAENNGRGGGGGVCTPLDPSQRHKLGFTEEF
jgi:hypothetical protein